MRRKVASVQSKMFLLNTQLVPLPLLDDFAIAQSIEPNEMWVELTHQNHHHHHHRHFLGETRNRCSLVQFHARYFDYHFL